MSSSLPNHRALMTGLTMGTWLNPMNSTMITVALIAIARDFGAGFAHVSWVVTVFYLVSCTAQPVLGRCADRFGPKRIFLAGMIVVLIATVWSMLATGIVSLSIARGLLAVGTACAYPSAVTLLGTWMPPGPESVRALGRIQVVNILGMALGPVAGGLLLAAFGWQAQFWLNAPPALLALILVARAAPADALTAGQLDGSRPGASLPAGDQVPAASGAGRERTHLALFIDVPGIIGFTVAMSALILALLDSLPGLRLVLFAVAIITGAVFAWWELRAPHPVLDLRALKANTSLLLVLAQFATFNVIFYLWMFGLPQFFEIARGYPVAHVGMLMAVLATVSALSVMPATRLITRLGLRPFVFAGCAPLFTALLLMWLVGTDGHPVFDVLILAVAGMPYGLIPLGLNQGMFASAQRGAAGVAAGLFQLTRYLGAVIAMVIMALVIGEQFEPDRWQPLIAAMAISGVIALGLVALWRPPNLRR